MKQFNEMVNEASDLLSRDFIVGTNALSNQTKGWLKELDAAVEKYKLSYDQCRLAARKFKLGDFEGALKTIWGKKLDVEVVNSENGGNKTVRTYTVDGYGVFTETIEFKDRSFIHSVTAKYNDATTADVTASATFSGYDMAVAGTYTVTVSYTEGEETVTATYQITVVES